MKKFIIALQLVMLSMHLNAQMIYDNGPIIDSESESYSLVGSKWNKKILYYYIYNTSNHLTATERETAVKNAFNTWTQNSSLTLVQTKKVGSADLKIKWVSGNHGDGYSFDGSGNVLAHAFFPPPAGGTHAGELHFDDDENWTTDGTGIDLETVALHEIGHLLGLNHSSETPSIMNAYYTGIHRTLEDDDLLAIWTLYGLQRLEITGDQIICDSSVYYIAGIPNDCTVEWQGYSSSGAPSPTLQSDYPSHNQCMIKNKYHYPMSSTLTATIKYNGNVLGTVSKDVASDDYYFYGTYEQESCNYYGVTHPAIEKKTVSTAYPQFIHQGCMVTITSKGLKHHTVTYDGVTPEFWDVDDQNGKVYFKLPLYSAGVPFYVYVGGDGCCTTHRILFFSITGNGNLNTSSLSISSLNSSTWALDIVENKDETAVEVQQASTDNLSEDWQIEVYHSMTGRKMLLDRLWDKRYLLSTSGWESGTYIVRVFSKDNVYVNKISVR